MRNLLLALPLSLIAFQFSFAVGPCDTTLTIANGSPGYNTGTYDPNVGGALNSFFAGCTDTAMTLKVAFANAGLGDTLKLSNAINVSGRDGKVTRMIGQGTGGTGVVTFTESDLGNPQLLTTQGTSIVQLTNFGFARKGNITTANYSVTIGAKGSSISSCHFWMQDNTNIQRAAMLDIEADSVLVERSLFRTPQNGVGQSIAIRTGLSANKVEIRSNIFVGTGVLFQATSSVHVFANSFVGSRNAYNFIICESQISNPEKNVNIQHNLFAAQGDSLPPIFFTSNPGQLDSIRGNAWSRSSSSVPLVMKQGNVAGDISLATGADVNSVLPRGFSNYAGTVPVKDYPLTGLKTDATLAPTNSEFGKFFNVFTNTGSPAWTTMSDIVTALPPGKSYFTGFAPYVVGQSWSAGIKIGAFVAQDALAPQNPLENGAQGAALTFAAVPNSGKIKLTSLKLDSNYYKTTKYVPTDVFFAFDTTLNNITIPNDSTALKTATSNNTVSKKYSAFIALGGDSLTVPLGLRNGKDLYVKMLHYRSLVQANFPSTAGIATVTGVTAYPANDITIAVNKQASNFLLGNVTLTVSHGTEPIDSIKVIATYAGNNPQPVSQTIPATVTSINFPPLAKGTVHFNALPIVKITGGSKPGVMNADVGPFALHSVSGDTLYVKRTGDTCTGGDGSAGTPFCSLDSALTNMAINNNGAGGVIVVSNNTPLFAFEDVTIAAKSNIDTGSLTLISVNTSGKFEDSRPVFRGKNKSALTITRKNVTLRGFVIEMPGGSVGKSALSIKAEGVHIDANIFRSGTKAGAEGPAFGIDTTISQSVFSNNVVWGFTKAATITNSNSAGIKILNNTFLDDNAVANTGKTIGISVVGTALNAVIANNFFSNIKTPLDVSVAGKAPVLDHNVFTVANPALQGLTDLGALDTNASVKSIDLTAALYTSVLDGALSDAFSCSSVHPCPSLQAASSSVDYKVTIATDIFGRARGAKKDVGAYEVNPVTGTVLGRLAVKANKTTLFSTINFTLTTKNFDPAESDSIHVWWTTAASGGLDTTVPITRQKHYLMAKLATGTLTDTILGLSENTFYHIYAAYSRYNSAATPPHRDLSYVYSDTVTTSVNIEAGDCTFQTSSIACPSTVGYFANVPGPGIPTLNTTFNFVNTVPAGSFVKKPTFVAAPATNTYNLDLVQTFPQITFSIGDTSLGKLGSNQVFTANIKIKTGPLPDLSGQQLFLLPDLGSLPILVSTWKFNAVDSSITIQGTKGGALNYAFGKLSVTATPGKIEEATPDIKTFNYATAGDSVNHISITIKGSGFKTSNPLIFVTVIPAGGSISKGLNSGVLSGKYPVKSLVLSADLADLDTTLRKDRFYKYYLKAASVDGKSVAPGKMVNPFGLDSLLDSAAFNASVVLQNPNLALTGAGVMNQTAISIPIDVNKYKSAEEGRKASRSFEIAYTVFDGSQISRGHSYVRSQFNNQQLQQAEKSEKASSQWNLFGYPWDETSVGNLARVLNEKNWNADLMRAMKYKGSGTGAGSFVTFSGASAADAKFDSGQAIWTGYAKPYTPSCDSGISLDYQTFGMKLTGGVWTDVSLPFNFPIRVRDVLDSSGLTAATIPAWFIFTDDQKKWTRVTEATILMPWQGMTIKPGADLTLNFPVLDSTRTIVAAPKNAAGKNDWVIDLKAVNVTAVMDLQVGGGTQPKLFSEPPDVPGQNFRVGLKYLNPNGKIEKLSQFVQSGAETTQGHWPLIVSAGEGSKGIDLQVRNNQKSVPLYLVEGLSKTVTPLANDPIHLSESDLKNNDYHLVAGSANYLQSILSDLSPLGLLSLSNYPNPFANTTSIRYALPSSFGKVEYTLKVRDFLGRTVFARTTNESGSFNYVWDGKNSRNSLLPSGVYTLFLDAKVEGKTTYHASRRIMKM